jgi:hypothetical protein
MPVKFQADFDSKNLENKLRIFSAGLGGIFKELMAEAGKEMVAGARARASFTNRTGRLSRNITFISTSSGGVFTTRKNNKSNAFYSLFIEKGANIKPRKEKYLVFKIDGEWKKVKSVRLRPRPFMGPVFDEYWEGENAKGYKALADALRKKMEEALS